ncbi:MAG: hypothetical protein WBA38_04065 [Gordonia sp. (in: high G+C Gram-positive bacteria)]|uniref:hypothetical protein n=1 Tax=Gordonia sp. (in: high G+C Gram-positive bacteria) TaxID=84139 RepID=UPI003C77073F
MMNKLAAAGFAALAAVAITGCGNEEDGPGIPVLSGQDASIVAQADCGEDGVANVRVQYGDIDDTTLIGRNPTTLGIGQGSPNFDHHYGISEGYKNLSFTITTSPTKGTCVTTLTDRETGDVLATRESAGTVKLEAIMAG